MKKKREKIPPEYLKAFTQRVVEARKFTRLNQAEMADKLGIGIDAYKTYEGRSLMPHYLIPKFSEITGQTVHILMGGGVPRRPTHIQKEQARELLDVFDRLSRENQEFAIAQMKIIRTISPTSDEQRKALAEAMAGKPSKPKG